MQKTIGVSLIICTIILLCPLTSAMTPVSPSTMTSDWPDGRFQGTWSNTRDNITGSMWGVLNVGRRSTRGTLTGNWMTSDELTTGTLKAGVLGELLFGKWMIEQSSTTIRFFARLTSDDTQFSARLITSSAAVITISGVYEVSFLPKPKGPYGIGVQSMHVIDLSRPEYFTTDPDDVREMMMQIWYPLSPDDQGKATDYMDYPTFQWLKQQSPIPLVTIPNDAYLFVRPYSRETAPIAEGIFPVVVFSPGYDGVYQIYTSFIEDLVSHGFVVVSLNHPYVSGITVFPDGRTVEIAAVPQDPVERAAFFNMSLRTVVEDAKFALNVMTELNADDPMFSGHFELSAVGMYGHSFGGASTAVCCYEDPRFIAGLTLDGVFYTSFIPGDINAAFLMMFAELKFTPDEIIQYMWDSINNDTYKLTIAGSTHYAYTDVGLLLSHLVPLIPHRLLGFGSIMPKRMVNITSSSVTAFFSVYLKGEPLELMLNLPSLFQEIELEYKLP